MSFKFQIYLFLVCCSCFGISCKTKTEQLVKDNASVFSKNEVENLNKLLIGYKEEANKQILVYTILNTGNIRTPQIYSEELIERINFGEKGFDNSFLIFIYSEQKHTVLRWGKNFSVNMSDSLGKVLTSGVNQYFSKFNFEEGIIYLIKEIRKLPRLNKNK